MKATHGASMASKSQALSSIGGQLGKLYFSLRLLVNLLQVCDILLNTAAEKYMAIFCFVFGLVKYYAFSIFSNITVKLKF